jgi:hypothetical protein
VALILAHFAVLTLSASDIGIDDGDAAAAEHRSWRGSHGRGSYSQQQQPTATPSSFASQSDAHSSWSHPEIADVAILAVYTVEMCLRIFALGLARHKHAYLRNAYNRLDAAVVVASWALIVANRATTTGNSFSLRTSLGQFRLFRAMLALREFRLAGAVVAIVEALSRSVETLADLGGVIVLCGAFYGLMGMSMFGGSLRRRCVLTDSPETAGQFYYALGGAPGRELFCGDVTGGPEGRGFSCPELVSTGSGGVYGAYGAAEGTGGTTYTSGGVNSGIANATDTVALANTTTNSSSSSTRGGGDVLRIPATASLYCSELPGNPKFGRQSFDNFGSTLLTMFTCITLEGWDEVMYAVMNAEYRIAGGGRRRTWGSETGSVIWEVWLECRD